jgi:zinc transporter 1/2/3
VGLSEQYTLKLIALVLIFAVGLAGGLAALGAQRSKRRELLFSLGSALAAGIFLGAGLIHLLPDGVEALASYFTAVNFPVGYLIATLGFLLVVYIEMVYLAGRHDPVSSPDGPGVTAYALVVILSIH